MRKFIAIFLFILSFKALFSNENFDRVISGIELKALEVAYSDFKDYEFPIERYNIYITKQDVNLIITFVPIIEIIAEKDTVKKIYGNPDFGKEVTYIINLENLVIVKKHYGR